MASSSEQFHIRNISDDISVQNIPAMLCQQINRETDRLFQEAKLKTALELDEFGVPKTSAEFSSEDVEILFGKDVNIDDVFDQLDRDGMAR